MLKPAPHAIHPSLVTHTMSNINITHLIRREINRRDRGVKLIGYADDVALIVQQASTPRIEIVAKDSLI